jgi:hypothetical protein
MNTKMNAIAMTLLMIASALAGCTSGDPDGDGTSGIDMEILNEMIDDNLQDFINNTSVTVNNYHSSNETYHNYNSNNYSFGGVGSNGSGGHGLYLLDIQFNLSSLLDLEENDYQNNSITGQYWLQDFDTGNTYEDNVTIDCGVYYIVGSDDFNSWNDNSSLWEESYWINSDWYSTGWSVYESLGYEGYNITMRNLYHNIAWDYEVREICDESFHEDDEGFDDLILFEISIPAGVAISGLYHNDFRAMEEYVWGYEDYTSSWNNGNYIYTGSGENMWRNTYYPLDYQTSAFNVNFEFETISWSYHSGGWVGGDGESILSVSVNDIYPGYEYRLIAYFTMAPVVSLE